MESEMVLVSEESSNLQQALEIKDSMIALMCCSSLTEWLTPHMKTERRGSWLRKTFRFGCFTLNRLVLVLGKLSRRLAAFMVIAFTSSFPSLKAPTFWSL